MHVATRARRTKLALPDTHAGLPWCLARDTCVCWSTSASADQNLMPSRLLTVQIEKDEDYIKTVVALGARLEQVIRANNAIDVYEEYFPDKAPDPGSDAPGAKR